MGGQVLEAESFNLVFIVGLERDNNVAVERITATVQDGGRRIVTGIPVAAHPDHEDQMMVHETQFLRDSIEGLCEADHFHTPRTHPGCKFSPKRVPIFVFALTQFDMSIVLHDEEGRFDRVIVRCFFFIRLGIRQAACLVNCLVQFTFLFVNITVRKHDAGKEVGNLLFGSLIQRANEANGFLVRQIFSFTHDLEENLIIHLTKGLEEIIDRLDLVVRHRSVGMHEILGNSPNSSKGSNSNSHYWID